MSDLYLSRYAGPTEDVRREQLAEIEATGKYVCEEKIDGRWALVTVVDGAIERKTT